MLLNLHGYNDDITVKKQTNILVTTKLKFVLLKETDASKVHDSLEIFEFQFSLDNVVMNTKEVIGFFPQIILKKVYNRSVYCRGLKHAALFLI